MLSSTVICKIVFPQNRIAVCTVSGRNFWKIQMCRCFFLPFKIFFWGGTLFYNWNEEISILCSSYIYLRNSSPLPSWSLFFDFCDGYFLVVLIQNLWRYFLKIPIVAYFLARIHKKWSSNCIISGETYYMTGPPLMIVFFPLWPKCNVWF